MDKCTFSPYQDYKLLERREKPPLNTFFRAWFQIKMPIELVYLVVYR